MSHPSLALDLGHLEGRQKGGKWGWFHRPKTARSISGEPPGSPSQRGRDRGRLPPLGNLQPLSVVGSLHILTVFELDPVLNLFYLSDCRCRHRNFWKMKYQEMAKRGRAGSSASAQLMISCWIHSWAVHLSRDTDCDFELPGICLAQM